MLVAAWLAGCLVAQDRHATVKLDDGRVISGRVTALDLGSLQLQVGDHVERVEAMRIQSCVFEPLPAAAEMDPSEGAAPPIAQEQARSETSVAADAQRSGRAPGAAPANRPRFVPRTLEEPAEVLQAAALDPDAQPVDLRHRPLWRLRLERLDQTYPWLCPAAPVQWISLGSLLFALLSLGVFWSTRIAGLDRVTVGGSMLMAFWYLGAGALQFCLVPGGDLPALTMMVGNVALACFWLRQIFGLTRSATVVALAVQLGFAVLAFGVLEFVDSLLRSVHAVHP